MKTGQFFSRLAPVALPVALSFAALAIIVNRTAPLADPKIEAAAKEAREAAIEQASAPRSIQITTGSVEHRLRAMEAQLVELRNRLDRLEAGKGGAR